MENDFHEHIDTARLWWELEDPVLVAISEGPSTQGPFRAIALYVLELKRRNRGAEDITPALTKIAIRIAASPQLSQGRNAERRSTNRMSAGRTVAVIALVLLALAALLTAAAAAEIFPVPEQVRHLL